MSGSTSKAIGHRIRALRVSRRDSARSLAAAIGTDGPTLTKYETGKRKKVPTHLLSAIAKHYGVDLDWLATGRGPVPKGTVASPVSLSPDAASIPLMPPRSGEYRVDPSVVLGRDIGALRATQIEDDSMEPKWGKGSFVVVDTSNTTASGGYWVLRVDEQLIARRIQKLPGRLRAIPLNDAYERHDVGEDAIVGEIIWGGGNA